MNKILACVSCLALLTVACGPVVDNPDAGGQSDAGTQAACTSPNTPLECEDQNLLQLSLHDFVSAGTITNTDSAGVFTSVVDATAGGMNAASNNPFIYGKFTDNGLEKVEIDDESAFASMDWDLMARRFVILLNSGDIGPSCVGAVAASGSFDQVTAAPAGAEYRVEDAFDGSCTLQLDTRYSVMGFETPSAVLQDWWEYPEGCVKTSGDVFVVRLASGRLLKMVVDEYYASGQADCNTMGVMGSGSAMLKIRWAWL